MAIDPWREHETPEIAANRMVDEILDGIQNSKLIISGHIKQKDKMKNLFDSLLGSPGYTSDDLRETWPISEGVGINHNIVLSIASLVTAIHLSQKGRYSAAWTFVVDARHYMSALEAFGNSIENLVKTKARRQGKLIDARHHENRDMKKQAIDWYLERRNTGLTKDAAAEAIAGKIVAARFRTVRKWLTNVK